MGFAELNKNVDDGGNGENIRSEGKQRGMRACEVATVTSAPRETLDNGHGLRSSRQGKRRGRLKLIPRCERDFFFY
jgi:hypothetical protein